jgi:hypothetical protein
VLASSIFGWAGGERGYLWVVCSEPHLRPECEVYDSWRRLICTKTLGSIGAMTSALQRSGLEFRFERGASPGLKSFIARLDEFRTGVAL